MSMLLTVMDRAVFRILLRIAAGERVQPYRGSFSAMTLADKLRGDGLVEIARTPGGRKAWYELTAKGRNLLLAARAWQLQEQAHHAVLQKLRERDERIELAEPKCYRYVVALADAGDPDAIRFLKSIDAFDLGDL
jgi:hypothetical protein